MPELAALIIFVMVLGLLIAGAAIAATVVVTCTALNAGRTRIRTFSNTARAAIPGPVQPVYALRDRVRRELTSALGALSAARAAGRPVTSLTASTTRLENAARQLDLDLAIIAGEPDPQVRAGMLAEQAKRIETFAHACAQLRRGAVLAGGTDTDGALDSAARELSEEIDRLRFRAEAYQDLNRPWKLAG